MKQLKKYGKKRFHKLEKNLISFSPDHADESLHDIRVEIKKIKSLLRLISFINSKFDFRSAYKPFRKIFRAAGKIRDMQVSEHLLQQYGKHQSVNAQNISELVIQFENDVAKYLKSVRKKANVIIKELKSIGPDYYHEYLHNIRRQFQKLLPESVHAENLHDLRKQAKELIYILTAGGETGDFTNRLSVLEQMIGEWHDKKVLSEWLQQQLPDETDIIRQLNEQSETAHRNIVDYIQTHLLTHSDHKLPSDYST
jgi:CHAD domain-containing protein